MSNLTLNKSLLILEYLKKYPNIFNQDEIDFILKYTENNSKERLIPEVVREIYDELGFISDNENLYIGFINLIKSLHNIESKNILEVGGGILPRLGERIVKYLDTGSFTVYDPRLSIYKKGNDKLKLVRKNFDKFTNVNKTDLIIGLMPCKAAEVIVEVATKNGKDFILALCEGGVHGDEEDFYEDDEEWRQSLIKHARKEVEKKDIGKLKIKYMKEYNNPYPVIYNERI